MLKKIMRAKQTKIILIALLVAAILGSSYALAPDAPAQTENTQRLTPESQALAASGSSVIADAAAAQESAAAAAAVEKAAAEKKAEEEEKAAEEKKAAEKAATPSKPKQDKYKTDPTPAGKPKPQEPQDTAVDKQQSLACTFSINCATILDNMDKFNEDKLSILPPDGVILPRTTVTFYEGESVFDALKRVTQEKKIHMEFSNNPLYNSAYIEGIHNLYEFDCGELSGWMYKVNGWFPNYGCSRYVLRAGDEVEWVYTCDLGYDVGGGYAAGG
jgi:flagellar biosynthesis GTPase FlhF